MQFLFLAVLVTLNAEAHALTEAEFIRALIAHNPQLAALKMNPDIAASREQAFEGQFDTTLYGASGYLIDQSAQANPIFGSDNRQWTYGLGLEKKFSFGLNSDVQFHTNRSTSDSAFVTLSPYYEPELSLALRQNLVQNSFGARDRKARRVLRLEHESVSLKTGHDVDRILAEGIEVYWNLAMTQSFVNTSERFLSAAESFMSMIGKRLDLGTAEETDRLAARALVLERKNTVLAAKARLSDAQEWVTALLGETGNPVRATEPASFRYSRSLDDEIQSALLHRSDLLALCKDLDAKHIELAIDRQQKLPVIDLVGSFALNGIAGDYSPALEETIRADNPSAQGGIELSFPLENRAAKAQATRDTLEQQQLLLRIKDLETAIIRDVRHHYRDLHTRLAQLENMQTMSRLYRDKWQAERDKFLQGRSASDTVIRYEREHVDAEWRALEAQLLARIAWIHLRHATGVVLP